MSEQDKKDSLTEQEPETKFERTEDSLNYQKEEALTTTDDGEKSLKNENDVIYTIDDAISKAGFGKFQIILLTLSGVGWIADAGEMFILSVIGDFIACDWVLYRWQIAFLSSAVFGAEMIGAPICGKMADLYGRKWVMIVSIIFMFFFSAISAASPNYTWLVIFRSCMGFSISGSSQGITLCSEYCPPDLRGRAGFYLCYFWSFGSVGAILLAWVIMTHFNNWRIFLAVASVPALLGALSFKWYPESARYYIVSGQYEQAISILQKMAKTNGTVLPAGKLEKITEYCERGSLKDLLKKQYRLAALLVWYIWLATEFAYYGIALISPLIIRKGSLISDHNNITNGYFGELSSSVPCASFSHRFYIELLWTTAAEFPGLIIFSYLVEKVNRKMLLSSSCFISSILILLLLLNTSKVVILLILFGVRGFLVAVTQLIIIITSEIFPTTFRALAIGVACSIYRLGGIVVPYVAQVLVINSPIAAMCLLSGGVFLSGIAAAFLPFETKGVKLKDVSIEEKEIQVS